MAIEEQSNVSLDVRSEDRERFLIGIAKFLGESPTPEHPLARVQICDPWFLSELLVPILPGGSRVELNFERFNQLMLASGRSIVSRHFFQRFFGRVETISGFESAVEDFRIRAMWLFGNFRYAYKRLAMADVEQLKALLARTEARTTADFDLREPFTEIERIPESDLPFLGYVSGQSLEDLAVAVDTLRIVTDEWDARDAVLSRFGSETKVKLGSVLKNEGYQDLQNALPVGDKAAVLKVMSRLKNELSDRRRRQAGAQAIGERNTQRYLTLPHLDVYVATSMRTDDDFVSQHRFIQQVFADPQVIDLKLRYFDPTASYVDDRIKKGLIECLMLRRAKVTIYVAGPEDTMGKDSELAATLAQGKPVIVYVQSEPRFVRVRDREVDMDVRAKIFQADHPLGLQISVRNGVAHGIIVVRTPQQCANMLRRVLLHDLRFSIQHEAGNFKLVEQETKSILRVVTDDPLLSHSFWTYFRHVEPEPDI